VKIIGITQARIGSSRLPGKVLLTIKGKTLLQIHLERAKASKLVNKWLVATTHEQGSDLICDIASKLSLGWFKGSLDDVLDRFYLAAKDYHPDYVVRITSDCPLVDPQIIDKVVKVCVKEKMDYASNTLIPTFPDGIDVEVFRFSALEKAWKDSFLPSEREHVTPYICKNSTFFNKNLFKSTNITAPQDFSKIRLTVDQKEDFDLLKLLIENIGSGKSYLDYIVYLNNNQNLLILNSNITRNQGFMKSEEKDNLKLRHITNFTESDKYRNQIHDLIPGGAHTYSKGDDQFPELSPAAISHGSGAYLWDIDGNKFLDCSMGLTSVSLGHAYDAILNKVKAELDKGVNFQRPSIIEKEMAEKFLALIPQHDMVKFAKNGSIVTTAAVKLARAKTGRKLVAFPIDHPFYSYDDWFIGKTACSRGVPKEIQDLSVTFNSCDLNSFKELFQKYPNQIACVITEPERSALGKGQFGDLAKEFLKEAIELTHQNGALFIIDEMITGFKTAFPGTMTKYNLNPDLATWGKGIANGFSFCALTGKKEVMELGGIRNEGAEKVFLTSTTHGGETHSLAAGLACIEEFKNNDVIKHNHEIGDDLVNECNKVINQAKLNDYIEIIPCNWLPVFIFKDKEKSISMPFRTLVMQEMIKRGVLFQGAFVPCFSHTKDDVNYFVDAFKETLDIYSKALESGIGRYLIGKSVKPVFRKIL
jgi:glutamate-1-semialdehyde aminotransferase/spore coat polysaccharide biosynthesis protein SpsF (cytidylyltransferase family)